MQGQIRNVKKLQRKSRRLTVRPQGQNRFAVSSGSGNGDYSVALTGRNGSRRWICDCRWGQVGGRVCCHRMAVMDHLAGGKMGRRLSFWLSEEAARRQRRPVVERNGLFVTMRKLASA